MSNPIPLAYIPEIKEENPQKMQETQCKNEEIHKGNVFSRITAKTQQSFDNDRSRGQRANEKTLLFRG